MAKMKKQKVYFIGIGGIGVSALAQWYLSEGWAVSGSDARESEITKLLAKKGVKVHIGPMDSLYLETPFPSGVIYSAAISATHPERLLAKKRGIPQFSYAGALAELTKRYRTIAVCGAHGKSTTTAMVALMLIRAGFDPTVIVGTKLKEFGDSNFRKGGSEWLVLEADEFHGSFLSYHPYAIICTNIDREHLEYYKTLANIKKAFQIFFSRVNPRGVLVLNKDNEHLAALKIRPKAKAVFYTLRSPRAKELKKLLKVPGAHNVSNALACDVLGHALGIALSTRNTVLSRFRGTWRRFEARGIFRGAKIYDDYAHHPTEIQATIAAAREAYPTRTLRVVFQPHLSERLAKLFFDFVQALRRADEVIILETYRVLGRDGGILGRGKAASNGRNAEALAKQLGKKAHYQKTEEGIISYLRQSARPNDLIITMGAGNVTNIASRLAKSRLVKYK